MHVLITEFNGNPNIGLYGFCNDHYCLLGREIPENRIKEIEQVLKVPCHKITIAGTSLIGIFLTGNNKKLLVPSIAFDSEIHRLKELKIDFDIINTKTTCLGNNILMNDNGAIINPDFKEREKAQIEKALKCDVDVFENKFFKTPGSLAVLNNNGMYVSSMLTENEIDFFEKILKIRAEKGTINLGNSYIKSGILTNKNGFVIGNISGGPEIVDAERALGFVNYE